MKKLTREDLIKILKVSINEHIYENVPFEDLIMEEMKFGENEFLYFLIDKHAAWLKETGSFHIRNRSLLILEVKEDFINIETHFKTNHLAAIGLLKTILWDENEYNKGYNDGANAAATDIMESI